MKTIKQIWNNYKKLDHFGRRDFIKKNIVKSIEANNAIEDKKLREYANSTMIQSYIDDVIEALEK